MTVLPHKILEDTRINWVEKLEAEQHVSEVWPGCRINDRYFWLDIPQLATFEVKDGRVVNIQVRQPLNENLINLYLNGTISGVLLQQRQILAMHAGAFIYNGKGIVICGESEAGKSSLNLAFCKEGAAFLCDDLTPLTAGNVKPSIQAIGERIKIWKDSLYQLSLEKIPLPRVEADNEKYLMQMEQANSPEHILSVLIELKIGSVKHPEIEKLTGPAAFEVLRNQVFKKEHLLGMPETEKAYLMQLSRLVTQVPIFRITRPRKIHISETQRIIAQMIEKL